MNWGLYVSGGWLFTSLPEPAHGQGRRLPWLGAGLWSPLIDMRQEDGWMLSDAIRDSFITKELFVLLIVGLYGGRVCLFVCVCVCAA